MRKYEDDPTLSWEERYKRLEAYHIAEVTELNEIIETMRVRIDELLAPRTIQWELD